MRKALKSIALFAALWATLLLALWGSVPVIPNRFVTTPAVDQTKASSPPNWTDFISENSTGAYRFFWRGSAEAPRAVQLIVDFQQSTILDKIEIDTIRDSYNDLSEVTVLTRDGAKQYAVAARKAVPKNGPLKIDLPPSLGAVRFVKLRLTRRDNYLNIGIKDIRFWGIAAAQPSAKFDETADPDAELLSEGMLIDKFGQYLYEDWPTKIKSPADLIATATADNPEDSISPHAGFDEFGGNRSFGHYETTGFFHLEKIDGIWWFISPCGHPFFLKGVAATDPHDPSYATSVSFTPGKPRQIFKELPAGTSVSQNKINFIVANLRQKYGKTFEAAWSKSMMRRFGEWGFNASGKWSKGAGLRLPYITVLTPAAGIKRIKWAADPFDDSFELMVRNGVKGKLDRLKDSPWVIGHTFESEAGWTTEIVNALFMLPRDAPARRAFIEFVSTRIHSSLEMQSELKRQEHSLSEILTTAKSIPPELKKYAPEFIRVASERYYSTVSRIIRELDPNHLFLGSSLTPGWRSSFEWEAGSAPHVDALSFDVYSKSTDWVKRYTDFDKPILVLEFGFACAYRGMDFFPSASAESEGDRGTLFSKIVKELSSIPQVVGTNWFLLYDQPVGGNGNGTRGENYNLGLINQQDVPYQEMLDHMSTANFSVYEWHAQSKRPGTEGIR